MIRLAQLWVSLVLTAYDASIGVTEGFGLWSRRVSGRYHDNPERDPMTNGVNIEKRGAIMVVTLDRPKANAIDAQTSRDLGAAFVDPHPAPVGQPVVGWPVRHPVTLQPPKIHFALLTLGTDDETAVADGVDDGLEFRPGHQ